MLCTVASHMSRRIVVAALLAAFTLAGAAVPGQAPRALASSCSSWTSESEPPPTIRVFRHASGAVDTVDFRTYTKNVLSREWIGSWSAESLRSGALAVKSYAWYQVLHWRGGTNADGACFDLRDDTWDQVYDPTRTTWSAAAAAVDATWATRVLKNGKIFPTYYNAGAINEACGANANGWKAYQWGTQACGLDGKSAAEIILIYYYPNVTVTDAPVPATTPAPAPTQTPAPTAPPVSTPTPTPAPTPTPPPTPSATVPTEATTMPTPTATPVVTPAPTPTATPVVTPTPTPVVVATPPPNQELPGGGQSGVSGASAPPPPPPSNPQPVVAAASSPEALVAYHGALRDWERSTQAMRRVLEWTDPPTVAAVAPIVRSDLRLTAFRMLWEETVRDLLRSLSAGLVRSNAGLALPWGRIGR